MRSPFPSPQAYIRMARRMHVCARVCPYACMRSRVPMSPFGCVACLCVYIHSILGYLRRWASGAKHRSPSQRSSAGVTIVTEGWAFPLTLPLFDTHTHTHTHTNTHIHKHTHKMIMAVTSPFSTFLIFTVTVSVASCSASGDREGVWERGCEWDLYAGYVSRHSEQAMRNRRVLPLSHAGEWEVGGGE